MYNEFYSMYLPYSLHTAIVLFIAPLLNVLTKYSWFWWIIWMALNYQFTGHNVRSISPVIPDTWLERPSTRRRHAKKISSNWEISSSIADSIDSDAVRQFLLIRKISMKSTMRFPNNSVLLPDFRLPDLCQNKREFIYGSVCFTSHYCPILFRR